MSSLWLCIQEDNFTPITAQLYIQVFDICPNRYVGKENLHVHNCVTFSLSKEENYVTSDSMTESEGRDAQ